MPSPPSLRHLVYKYRNHYTQLDQIHALLTTTGFFLLPRSLSGLSPSPDGEGHFASNIRWDQSFVLNTLIRGLLLRQGLRCSSSTSTTAALHLFNQMLAHLTPPNNHTFPPLIKWATISTSTSSASLLQRVTGRAMHAQVIRRGLVADNFINCCIVKFYGQLRDLAGARKMFGENPHPDVASCNAVLDALCKNGDVRSAIWIFDGLRGKDVVSWTTLINGFQVNGWFKGAICLFGKMMLGGGQGASLPKPNEATLVCVLSACASSDAHGSANQGREIHGYMVSHDVELTAFLGTALIDMYGKCGRIDCAARVFEAVANKEVCTWNAMISVMSCNGEEAHALDMFEMMKIQGMRPNGVTFVAVLTACAHSQWIDIGLGLFESMSCDYEIFPTMEHYGCMVDLFGRAGLFENAVEFIRSMPFEPDASVWGALLGACKMHQNVELATNIGTRLLMLQPHHSGRYMVLSNTFAGVGMWSFASKLKEDMEEAGVKKIAGCSWLET